MSGSADQSGTKGKWLSGFGKLFALLSGLISLIGVPLAGIIWFAAGMKTVPELSDEDLFFALPLPLLATILGGLAFYLELRRKKGFPFLSLVAAVVPFLTTLLLLGTYFSYR